MVAMRVVALLVAVAAAVVARLVIRVVEWTRTDTPRPDTYARRHAQTLESRDTRGTTPPDK
jgi:hypothetical protein